MHLIFYYKLQKYKSKKNDHQIDLETTKKKKLTTRQRKALTKIIEKKQKNQKVIINWLSDIFFIKINNIFLLMLWWCLKHFRELIC